MKRIALYMRTSTDKQENSPKIQEEALTKYCDAQGYQIVKKYLDFGYSGTNDVRPEFTQMMKDAELGMFDAVLITKIDRFARSSFDLEKNVRKLKSYGIDFISSQQPINTSDAFGKLFMQLLGIFAEFEATIITERMTEGRKNAIAEGKICHRPKKNINERQIEKLLNENKMSASGIAKYFGVNTSTIIDRLCGSPVKLKKEYTDNDGIKRYKYEIQRNKDTNEIIRNDDGMGYIYENKKWVKKEQSMEHKLRMLGMMDDE